MTRTAYSADETPEARRRIRAKVARLILPGERSLHGCGRAMIDRAAGVTVTVSAPAAGSTERGVGFSGTRRCGSVWLCPDCAASVSERRALDLEKAAGAWSKKGNTCALLTLTGSHGARDALQDLHDALMGAMKDVRKSHGWMDAAKGLGSIGMVRCLEATWGDVNGWHPHFHLLIFIRGRPSAAELEAFTDSVYSAWRTACNGNGLGEPSRARGVDLVTGVTVSERLAAYLAKFGTQPKVKRGIEREMAKSHTKRARGSVAGGVRYHPFALLDAYDETGDQRFFNRFLEYARVFKGSRQLVWSHGLKARLVALVGVKFDDRSDAEIAAEHRAETETILEVNITARDWVALNRAGLCETLCVRLAADPSLEAYRSLIWLAHARVAVLERQRTELIPSHLRESAAS